jgi:hypothetical protein
MSIPMTNLVLSIAVGIGMGLSKSSLIASAIGVVLGASALATFRYVSLRARPYLPDPYHMAPVPWDSLPWPVHLHIWGALFRDMALNIVLLYIITRVIAGVVS